MAPIIAATIPKAWASSIFSTFWTLGTNDSPSTARTGTITNDWTTPIIMTSRINATNLRPKLAYMVVDATVVFIKDGLI
jgi:hypothetical protein